MSNNASISYVTSAKGISAAKMKALMQAVVLPLDVYEEFLGLRVTSDSTTSSNPITRTIQFAFGPSGTTDATPVLQNDGSVISITPGNRGNDYIRPPFVAMSPIVRTPAKLRAFLRVKAFGNLVAGTLYTTAPTVTLMGGLPPADRVFDGCVRTIYLGRNPDGSFQGGLGYPSNTTVSILGGGPQGPDAPPTRQAKATPTIDAYGRITAITLTDMGAGYTHYPTVAFRSHGAEPKKLAKAFVAMANGTPATAHATINLGGVNAIVLDTPGRGYIKPPTVILTGGGGSGASAVARMEIDRVDVLFAGIGYPATATVVFTPYFKKLFPDGTGQDRPFIRLFKPQFVVQAITPIIASAPVLT
jgi:hypothetical protein